MSARPLKIFGLFMAALMLASVFAGCTNNKDQRGGVSQAGGFKPSKDLSLTVWNTQGTDYIRPAQPKENIVEDWLIKKTRVKVENIFGNGGSEWENKLTMLYATNNLPELVACGGGQGPVQFAKLADMDKIWELTPEMLQTYAPTIWKKVSPSIWDRIKVNGKIYGIPFNFPVSKDIDPTLDNKVADFFDIPNNDVTFNNVHCLWVRDDILKMIFPQCKSYDDIDKLIKQENKPIGDQLLDIPIKTTEEYVKFLYDVKALNLKEGNNPVYAMGYNGGDCWLALSWFGADLMGYKGYNFTSSWDPKNQKMRLPLLEPIVKEGALIQNRMIRDGVIDPESLVHSASAYKEKILNGNYALAALSMVDVPDRVNVQLKEKGKPYRYRPFYVQVPNKDGYPPFKEPPLWNDSVGVLKTVKQEDLPQILNWMNTMFTDEYEEIRYWGPKEAGLYEELPDGKRKFKDPRFQAKYVDGQEDALPKADTKGINEDFEGLYSLKFLNQSKWHPAIVNSSGKYSFDTGSGLKFAQDSPHVKNIANFPPCEVWSPEFANLDLVKKYWSSRSQWENMFKLAFTAKSDDEFNSKWEKAVKNLYSIVDVDKMLEDMTGVARKMIPKN